jgi:hypothetical protein
MLSNNLEGLLNSPLSLTSNSASTSESNPTLASNPSPALNPTLSPSETQVPLNHEQVQEPRNNQVLTVTVPPAPVVKKSVKMRAGSSNTPRQASHNATIFDFLPAS